MIKIINTNCLCSFEVTIIASGTNMLSSVQKHQVDGCSFKAGRTLYFVRVASHTFFNGHDA